MDIPGTNSMSGSGPNQISQQTPARRPQRTRPGVGSRVFYWAASGHIVYGKLLSVSTMPDCWRMYHRTPFVYHEWRLEINVAIYNAATLRLQLQPLAPKSFGG
ncbi:hypothetical protein BDQ12DRAFT_669985 [Crucibulum laeve]|uniref:Uncharacterized protein n=1 Tax=Crucibulum laeve TaxID=68775 RepID=A0A5C3LLX5_9AGAR|nr:hypothetical protein BDQ12DRAFT_669985 [Crucibulum laeve]